ncbi:MAG: hypothetical protein U5K71_09830 [Gracilimonas sp.]|nr:hypothetical protein [Gracilimonas sp.]
MITANEKQWHDGNGLTITDGPARPNHDLEQPIHGAGITQQSQLETRTWQQIFHLECDNKSRNREVIVTLIGE